MTQHLSCYKISEIADIWSCSEHHILELAAVGKITLSFLWTGNYWFYHNGKLVENDKSNPLNEFVNIEKKDVLNLIHGVCVEEDGGVETLTVSRQNGETIQPVIPSHEENTVHPPIIKISSLRILPEEIERFTVNHSEELRKISTNPIKDDLLPSERKSLVKMVFAMAVDGYGYDPDAKKSPIPNEIEIAAAKADIGITHDTIKKWLQEGAALREKDFKPK